MLTASSNRRWKKHGDCKTSCAVDDAADELSCRLDSAADSFCEGGDRGGSAEEADVAVDDEEDDDADVGVDDVAELDNRRSLSSVTTPVMAELGILGRDARAFRMVWRGMESSENSARRRRDNDLEARKGRNEVDVEEGDDENADEVDEGRGARISSLLLLAGLRLFPRWNCGLTKLLLLLLPEVLTSVTDSFTGSSWRCALSCRMAAPMEEEENWLSLTAGCRL